MSLMINLSKGTLIYDIRTLLQKVIGFVHLPFYIRALLTAEYDILDTLATLIFFVSKIFSLGLIGATSRYFFIADIEKEKKLLYTSATLRVFSFFVALLFFILFSSKISIMVFDTNKYSVLILLQFYQHLNTLQVFGQYHY
jgi:O-antigen/teichoic acid export membrane protein